VSQLAGGHASADGETTSAPALRSGTLVTLVSAIRGRSPALTAALTAALAARLGRRRADVTREVSQQVTRRVVRARPSRGGIVIGLLFFCTSLTPTLLPRTWLAQSLISTVATSTGYAIGAALGWVFMRVVPRRWFPPPGVRRLLVRGSLTAAVLLVMLALRAGWDWQRDLAVLMGERPPGWWSFLRVPGLTLLLVIGLVAMVRSIRRGVMWLVDLMRRWLPDGPVELLGVTAGLLVLVGVAEGVALGGFMSAANGISAYVNDAGDAGTPPASGLRSGGPGSLVDFSSLGREGRSFVTGGPSPTQLHAFAGPSAPIEEPIRVYVGLKSAPSTQDAAALAVRELERAGAFDRAVLCVVTTTGTGWVDPYLAAALEYMHRGNTAIVGVQYSYLPSWISFLSEHDRVAIAGPQLFDAVHARWAQLPAAHRPKLLVFAESLGSLGSEAGFTGLDDVRARTDGVLWSGPTNANPLWSKLVRERDPGTPEVLPVYRDGAVVRFVSRPEDLSVPRAPWSHPRVVYLQNASDPVTWWSPDLLWSRPDWLSERAGRDVLPSMRWYPVVTWLQVTADLALAYGAAPGHGHRFHSAAVAAWAAIDAPAGWTARDTARLATLLGP
jgi:uncharacterized membrane protein